MSIAYIALGSNLNDPEQQIHRCLNNIAQHPMLTIVKKSSLYLSEALLNTQQPNFINAVVKVSTEYSAQALMETLLMLETYQGRVRDGTLWGPRVIDLDLLLYDEEVIDSPFLKVPHPAICERAFVIVPLLEIAPDIRLPNGQDLKKRKATLLKNQVITKIN